MLPRMPGVLVLFTVLSASSAGLLCHAQQAQPVTPVRYHFGDDPSGGARWADPSFDDSAWPVAINGRVPVPAYYSDGFVWVRLHTVAPVDVDGPLALRQVHPESTPGAEGIYVNGRLVGGNGRLPPELQPMAGQGHAVFPLAANVVASGGTATVALRAWIHPRMRLRGTPFNALFEIDREGVLTTEARDHIHSLLLAQIPEYALFGVLFAVGLGLLLLWRITRRQELILFGLLLICGPAHVVFISLTGIGLLPWSLRTWDLIFGPLQILSPALFVVFCSTALALADRRWGQLVLSASICSSVCAFLAYWSYSSTPIELAFLYIGYWAALFRDAALIAILGWSMVRRPSNRIFTFLLFVTPVFSMCSILGLQPIHLGVFSINLFAAAVLLSYYALAGLLVQRAWQGWREGDTLRLEFEAAREVQEQLVAPAVDLPGFKIGSAYAPAKKVGGDFFRVIPESGGGVLVVVGDVSGKGLKAAMTVGAIMGALRDYPSRRPTEVLAHLNRVLYGQVSGFVTCCATLIASDGTMTLANAGNPAPYRNGEEMAVEPGLPLGMLGEVSYAETRYQIAVGDQLTFVSDGVVEATNTQGELYGFERTRAISKQPANAIAEAARQFGQEDDITVVTLTRESVKATASTQHSVPSLSV
jgi:sigma-B regulation protein RsbU (phosphoserine phosphatase)